MHQLFKTLELLRETASTKEKINILAEHKSDIVASVFKLAYDPFITFGISNIEKVEPSQDNVDNNSWFDEMTVLLNKLRTRELTGNAARDEISALCMKGSDEHIELITNILKKDLRVGVGTKLINKVYDNLLPENFCMSANKFNSKKVNYPVYADVKLDGVRCVSSFTESGVTLFSRNGRLFKNYTTIEKELNSLKILDGVKLDGEITCGHFQDLMKTVSRKEEGEEFAQDAVYNIFDVISEDFTLNSRIQMLMDLDDNINALGFKHVKVVYGHIIDNEDELLKYYNQCLEGGYEGVMVKDLSAKYEFRRSWAWQKMKPEHTDDLEIIDTEEGHGKYAGQLGVFICQIENGGTVRVGSGLDDAQRVELWDRRDELVGQVIEVKYQEKTRDGSLRFPVFVKFRPDKA